VPLVGGAGAGIATLAFRDTAHGVAMGGAIGTPAARGDYVAVTTDGGQRWTRGGRPRLAGPVYGGAYVPGTPAVVAVGPGGADLSLDDGRTWQRLDTLAYWSVGFAPSGIGWAVGPDGRIARLRAH
jgi:hypothetical protein